MNKEEQERKEEYLRLKAIYDAADFPMSDEESSALYEICKQMDKLVRDQTGANAKVWLRNLNIPHLLRLWIYDMCTNQRLAGETEPIKRVFELYPDWR